MNLVISFPYIILATGGVIKSKNYDRKFIFGHALYSNFLLYVMKGLDFPNFRFSSVVPRNIELLMLIRRNIYAGMPVGGVSIPVVASVS